MNNIPAGYKQTEVGVIPEDWQLRPLLSAVRVASGQVDPKIEPYRSMILVAPDHIESGSGRLLAKETAAYQKAISGKYLFENGDIVYSKIRPYLKKAILADFEGLCSADMYPLKPAADVSAGFIFSLILGHRFTKYAESVSVRSGMPKINRQELAEYTIALPPTKAEQEIIAAALSDVDALINSLDKLIAKKRDIKQGAMQELLTGKRRLPGFSGEWVVKRLGEIGTFRNGINKAKEDFGHGYPFVNLMDVFGVAKISLPISFGLVNSTSTERELYDLMEGDVLFVRSSVKPSGVGLTTLIMENLPDTVFSGFLLRFRDEEVLTSEYKVHCFGETEFRKQLIASSTVSANTNINQVSLRRLHLLFPCEKTEQTAIATILSDMDAEIAVLERKRDKTRLLKQGMMQELLTGRVRLN